MSAQQSIVRQPMRVEDPTATRMKSNHNWTRRGDNTKYREQK